MRFTYLAIALAAWSTPLAAQDAPMTAVISAFEPEWLALQADLENAEETIINGNRFISGTLEGREVVLFLSGISMVNAAMTSQLALDHFDINRILFSGIAGGVDPSLDIGDVVVPEQWGQYLEGVFARETEGEFALPPWMRAISSEVSELRDDVHPPGRGGQRALEGDRRTRDKILVQGRPGSAGCRHSIAARNNGDTDDRPRRRATRRMRVCRRRLRS